MKFSGKIPCALTMAGSVCGAGAGVQADMLTFAANGVYATSAIAALTAQNPNGISAIEPVSPEVFEAQIKAVFSFYAPRAAKTGMLFNAQLIETAANALKGQKCTLVADPVMISTSGVKLLRDDAVEALTAKLLPEAALITPNLDEAEFILGEEITNMDSAARSLSKKFGTSVLLKGGHLPGSEIIDVLAVRGGSTRTWKSRRVDGVNTHGSGCTLSAAITAFLALGNGLERAVERARNYILAGMENPVRVGSGSFINHFPSR